MSSPIVAAIKQICDEKHLSYEAVLKAVEAALAAAYRKDFGNKNQNIKVEFDPETASSRVFDVKTVVEDMELPTEEELAAMAKEKLTQKAAQKTAALNDVLPKEAAPAAPVSGEGGEDAQAEEKRFNPKTMMMISEAKKIKPDAQIGEELRLELTIPAAYGRMAAQTAKQVIAQKLREVERETIFSEFKEKEHELITGIIQRREGRVVLVDFGRAVGVMRPEDQIESEAYAAGSRVKVYVVSVESTSRGPEILVSRAHPELVRKLFSLEIPEVANGSVIIKAIAREAGSRTKIAVASTAENVDPIGSCIGQRGTRIQTIIAELGGEKVDVIEWKEDPREFIRHALSPAKTIKVDLNEQEKAALVAVSPDQLSLAIGRGGQNVRLAARLTGWKINVNEERPQPDASAPAAPTGETLVSD